MGSPTGASPEQHLLDADDVFKTPPGLPRLGVRLAIVIAFALSVFTLYTGYFGALGTIPGRALHLGAALLITFLLTPLRYKAEDRYFGSYDWIPVALSAAVTAYPILIADKIVALPLIWAPADYVFAAVTILLIMEASRRALGPIMAILIAISAVYALAGPLMAGPLFHAGISPARLLETVALSTIGIWGTLISLSVSTIALFVLFGAVLLASSGKQPFYALANWSARKTTGGSAKSAVALSALFGTLSGSSAANVATTGAITIPLMKKGGYPKEFAAATEAVASTGGQIMPPVMGAAAFIMAELVLIPYEQIALAAAIPAVLYFLAVYAALHFEARKQGFGKRDALAAGMVEGESVNWGHLVVLLLPIAVLLYSFLQGSSPGSAAFYATITTMAADFVVSVLIGRTPLLRWVRGLGNGLYEGAMTIRTIAVLLAAASIVVRLISVSGISVKIGQFIVGLSEGSLFAALLLAMVVAIVLGTGLPTTAAYVVGAAVVAPGLIDIGMPALPSHMFIFYFSVLAVITPPDCAAVLIGAGIAGANWIKTAIIAMSLAAAAWIMPFIWMYNPALLLDGTALEVVAITASTAAAMIFLAAAARGFLLAKLQMWERLVLLPVCYLLIIPTVATDIVGWIAAAVFMVAHAMRSRRTVANVRA